MSGGTSTFYKNDVITIENLVGPDAQPVPGTTTSIRFDLRNNGRDPVPKLVVDFFDTQGLTTTVNCAGGKKLSSSSCEFDNVPSLDSRNFAITFQIPGPDEIKGPITLTFNYEISYDYHGSRRIILPIIDTSLESQPVASYQIADPSVGPISADFDPPLGRTVQKDNNQNVQEYWGVKGDSFQIKTKIDMVADTTVGDVQPVVLKAGHVTLSIGSLAVDSQKRCDFKGSGGKISSSFDIVASGNPNSLVCSFISPSFSGAEKIVSVDANYDYTIQILRSATIQITPQKNIGGGTSGSGTSGNGQIV